MSRSALGRLLLACLLVTCVVIGQAGAESKSGKKHGHRGEKKPPPIRPKGAIRRLPAPSRRRSKSRRRSRRRATKRNRLPERKPPPKAKRPPRTRMPPKKRTLPSRQRRSSRRGRSASRWHWMASSRPRTRRNSSSGRRNGLPCPCSRRSIMAPSSSRAIWSWPSIRKRSTA